MKTCATFMLLFFAAVEFTACLLWGAQLWFSSWLGWPGWLYGISAATFLVTAIRWRGGIL
jgi:hypothetical protein